MKHLEKIIMQGGYSENEARVYLASLDLGEATVTDIADKAGIPRTTCQHAIRLLSRNGLMNYYAKRRRKYWVAENPQKLLSRLEEQGTLIKSVMPKLQSMRYAADFRPAVRLFRGVKEVRQIFDDIIESKHPILSLTAVDLTLNLFDEIFRDFITRRQARYLRVRLLTNHSSFAEELKKEDEKELRQSRFLPSSITLKNATFIYGDKTAIISLAQTMPAGIIISDPDFSAAQGSIFEYLWGKSSALAPQKSEA